MHSVAICGMAASNLDVAIASSPSKKHGAHLGKGSQRKGSQQKISHSCSSQAKCMQRNSSRGGRRSRVATLAEQFKASSQASNGFESSAGKSGRSRGQSSSERRPGNEAEAGDWTEQADEREQDERPLCEEMLSHQNEKDQRMWSALKTSLLSGTGKDADPSIVGLQIGRIDDEGTSYGDSNYIRGSRIVVARDMEQLDLERSAMDRTIRPHRIASARALEASQNSPSQTKVSLSGAISNTCEQLASIVCVN